jgi:hypothetical protein
VTLAGTEPLAVTGRNFERGERVKVVVTQAKTTLRGAATAGSAGTFVVRWKSNLPVVCASLRIVAVGSAGSRATFAVAANDCGGPPRR